MKLASRLRGPKPYKPTTPLAAQLAGEDMSNDVMPAGPGLMPKAAPPTTNDGSRAPMGPWVAPGAFQPISQEAEDPKQMGGPAQFSIGDIMGLQNAANQAANWGPNGVPNLMDSFEQGKDGMYSMRGQNGVPTALPANITGVVGSRGAGTVPWQDSGVSKADYLRFLQNQMRNVDESR